MKKTSGVQVHSNYYLSPYLLRSSSQIFVSSMFSRTYTNNGRLGYSRNKCNKGKIEMHLPFVPVVIQGCVSSARSV